LSVATCQENPVMWSRWPSLGIAPLTRPFT